LRWIDSGVIRKLDPHAVPGQSHLRAARPRPRCCRRPAQSGSLTTIPATKRS